MLEIRFGAIDGDGHTPVIARNGDHVGRVVDRDGDTRYVNVADDAPDAVVDALECDAGATRVAVPEAFVADDDGDRVRLVV